MVQLSFFVYVKPKLSTEMVMQLGFFLYGLQFCKSKNKCAAIFDFNYSKRHF